MYKESFLKGEIKNIQLQGVWMFDMLYYFMIIIIINYSLLKENLTFWDYVFQSPENFVQIDKI